MTTLMIDDVQNVDSSCSMIKQKTQIEKSESIKESQQVDDDISCDSNKNQILESQKQEEPNKEGESLNVSTSPERSFHSSITTPSKKVQIELPSSLSLLQDDVLFASSEETVSEVD